MESQKSSVVPVTHPSKLKNITDNYLKNLKNFKTFLYNKETHEVLGRDGLSWTKILLFYSIFYAILATFFIGYFAALVSTYSRERPKYVAHKSSMASTNDLNPGLGFRPQIDTEDFLILYGKNDKDQEKLIRNLRIYLNKYYDEKDEIGSPILNCESESIEKLRNDFRNGAYCQYDYNTVLEGTSCDPSIDFGYLTGPCVLIKLNRIFEWTPEPYENFETFPMDSNLLQNDSSILKTNVLVSCNGEYGADRDALVKSRITYYSSDSKRLGINGIGLLPFYYYPYLNQPGYKSPLIFVHFENIPQNQLINVVCKAYSANIDSNDKLNLRGMVKFQLFFDN